jgi:hypothetical protein
MRTRKQLQASRRNIKKAQAASRRKRKIESIRKKVRTGLVAGRLKVRRLNKRVRKLV